MATSPYLSGNYRPTDSEGEDLALRTVGELPRELEGVFVRNGSPEALVGALSDGRFEEVPGTHMSSVTEAALGEAIARFLSE